MNDERFAYFDSSNLRKWREAAGLSCASLAARSGVDRTTIWRIEHGHDPHLSTWRQLCGVLFEPGIGMPGG